MPTALQLTETFPSLAQFSKEKGWRCGERIKLELVLTTRNTRRPEARLLRSTARISASPSLRGNTLRTLNGSDGVGAILE